MTEDNQQQVTPDAPKFGSGDQPTTPSFGQEDIEKMLKQNASAQDHIKELEGETKGYRQQINDLRDELAKSKSIDDLLEGMQQENQPGPTAPQFDEQQLLSKLKEEVFRDLSAVQQESLEDQNWVNSKAQAEQKYGTGYASYVDAKALELDVPVEQMEQYARTSPKVFMELLSGSGTSTPSPTQGTQSQPMNIDADIEARFHKVATLRLDKRTPEGRQANDTWNDPEFQKQYRQHIMDKAKTKGSSFGNQI